MTPWWAWALLGIAVVVVLALVAALVWNAYDVGRT